MLRVILISIWIISMMLEAWGRQPLYTKLVAHKAMITERSKVSDCACCLGQICKPFFGSSALFSAWTTWSKHSLNTLCARSQNYENQSVTAHVSAVHFQRSNDSGYNMEGRQNVKRVCHESHLLTVLYINRCHAVLLNFRTKHQHQKRNECEKNLSPCGNRNGLRKLARIRVYQAFWNRELLLGY